jgi:DNA-binding CsgD family transcriptional regulator
VLGRLEALAVVIEGELAAGRAAHVRALAAGDADGLADVSAAFERMGADLLAAEAAAQAAVALRRRGEARRATATERRMEGLRERCEGAVTPALQAVGVRAPLTRSERRVALMAAEGRSNSEIAGVLCVSVRTVENHLRNAYDKLGIHGRAELAGALPT